MAISVSDGSATYVMGEKPPPLVYTFQDSAGTAINLTGYTAKFVIKEHDGAAQTFNAVVSAPTSGQVTYAWAGTEWPTAGHYEAEFVVGNTTNRYNSLKLTFNVRLPVGIEPNI
jgi:hypothetical protein